MALACERETRVFRASSIVDFPRIADFLDPIVSSIDTHDMEIEQEGSRFLIAAPFGSAVLEPGPGQLRLTVETTDRDALNRLKHALVGPITFIAASENLRIDWSGDDTGPSEPEDLRILQVTAVAQLTPRMRRITFRGENLARYDRADQLHCRLIFQPKGTVSPEWPRLDDRGHVIWPKGRKLSTRVYTVRKIDSATGEIEIDFALHPNPGPATQWAMEATPGDIVGVLGPAANGPKPAGFYILAGDETGLPGIARILEHLDADAHGIAFIEIDNADEEQSLTRPPNMDLRWLHRNGAPAGTASLLPRAIRSVEWPQDLEQAFFWGGCEHKAFREIHRMLRTEVQLPRHRQIFYSHWHRSLSEEEVIEVGGEAYLP
ncbi:NADPH-dependent ferric siderophore reductase, contains FAD-binding and SIP domains [Nitratireductor aquibiodomus]|uniref:NADPH-dependent ferric siderophore reductase, contains FAD-binding and SIP domains n=1 Tax=Nitratireductor aquibiodomus TaxID=204799 RepID=A0A1H4LUB3_9HYPH|nr:siderophore-interacting protein [Nitratireductor aquibiodomus]SEB73822.1 NADPH-dependent ferric siderophore reductase, contains FAD-binding and SIP domains [Nitratireductor aquibiodomus]